jgi:hypothetical protein
VNVTVDAIYEIILKEEENDPPNKDCLLISAFGIQALHEHQQMESKDILLGDSNNLVVIVRKELASHRQ